MATLSTPQQSDAGTRQALAPTATTFTPKVVEASKEVLNSSFITQTPPSLHQYAGIVAICTVSGDQAGMDNLGWHIADFLAFRALLCGDNPPKAQTWLAMCDIPALAEANPERYIHGKDRRLVGSAARPEQRQGPRGLIDREDNIQIETSAGSLKERFVTEVKAKLGIAKKHKYPLVLIVCGFTSPDQDIYFGRPDTEHRYTLGALRGELGDDINHVEAMVVTPSLFSAGWHINPSFGGTESPRQVRGGRADFLARQFGGLFAQDLSKSFLGWSCPVLDEAKVDPRTRAKERFPGPVLPSDEVKALASQLQIKIQSCLLGGLSTNHMDHSFSFDKSEDEWETLIGDRGSPPGYRALDWYEQKWAKFVPAQSKSDDGGLAFLGNAFGGTRASQLHHIKYLIEESYLAWPDHWASNFGQETRKDFERFMAMDNPDDLECHEIFNILENRVKQSVLADSIVQYFDLPMPHNHRSRDWHHFRFKQQLSEIDRSSSIKCFSTMLGCVPGPNLPPGVNPNSLSRLQSRLEIGVSYVRAALGIRYLTSKETSKGAVDRIETFVQKIKVKQAELLASDPAIYQMCSNWLKAIDMPVRERGNAIEATRSSKGIAMPEDTIGILDYDDAYDVYQEQGRYADIDATATPIVAARMVGGYAQNQQLLSLRVQQPETPAAEHPENVYRQPTEDTVTKTPGIAATRVEQDASVDSPQEAIEFGAEEARLLMAIYNSKDGREMVRLTDEIRELIKQRVMAQNLKEMTEQAAAKNNENEPPPGSFSTGANTNSPSGGKTRMSCQEPGPNSASHPQRDTPQSPATTQQVVQRNTPPHLRGHGSKRRA